MIRRHESGRIFQRVGSSEVLLKGNLSLHCSLLCSQFNASSTQKAIRLEHRVVFTLPRKSWTASACLRVHHPLTRLCNPLKRTGSEDGKRPKPDSCAWVVNLAYPERSFVVILPSWLPPAQHNTATATFRSCVLPVPVLRSPLISLIRSVSFQSDYPLGKLLVRSLRRIGLPGVPRKSCEGSSAIG